MLFFLKLAGPRPKETTIAVTTRKLQMSYHYPILLKTPRSKQFIPINFAS